MNENNLDKNLINVQKGRLKLQKILFKYYKTTAMVVKINYLVYNKSLQICTNIIDEAEKILETHFQSKIIFKMFRITDEGPHLIIFINEDPIKLKKMVILIEETLILGKCLDIDVYDNEKRISRKSLNIEPRRCMVCDKIAKECVINKNHSDEETMFYIQRLYKEYRCETNSDYSSI